MKLRKISEADLPERVRWMNDPLIYKTMHFIPPISLEKTKEWYHKNQTANRHDMVFEDEEGNLLAMGGLTSVDYTTRKAEFYIFVNPHKQRQGIGSKATYLLCKYGFEILKLHKIFLYTNANNIGARKTYEKAGFKLEGIHRDELIEKEVYEDRLYFGLINSELKDNKDKLIFNGDEDCKR